MEGEKNLMQEILSSPEDVVDETIEETQDEVVEESEVQEDQEEEVVESEEEVESEETTNEPETEDDESKTEEDESEVEKDDTEEEEKEEVIEIEDINPSILELAKEIDPETEFLTQEQAVKAISESYKNVKESFDKYLETDKQLIDVLYENDDVARFLKDLIDGVPPEVALRKNLLENISPEEEADMIEKYPEEMKRRKEEQKKKEEALAEFRENQKASGIVIKSFIKEKGVNEDDFNGYIKNFDSLISTLQNGKITPELLEMILRDARYERDIKDTEEAAYLKGKNEKIRLERKKKENTDGLPGLTSTNKREKEKPSSDIFDDILSQRGRRR